VDLLCLFSVKAKWSTLPILRLSILFGWENRSKRKKYRQEKPTIPRSTKKSGVGFERHFLRINGRNALAGQSRTVPEQQARREMKMDDTAESVYP